jgi:hypothetical protein
MSARMYRFSALAALALLSGCGASQIHLNVKSPPGTNLGRPMYMLVRQVDPKQYANEAYSEVAAKVGAPDDTVLQTAVIYPGTIQRFQVKTPKDAAAVAVSFLFTAPDGNWQMLLSPQSTSAVDVELTVSRILSNSVPSTVAPEGGEAPEAKAEAPKLPELPKEMPKLPGAK